MLTSGRCGRCWFDWMVSAVSRSATTAPIRSSATSNPTITTRTISNRRAARPLSGPSSSVIDRSSHAPGAAGRRIQRPERLPAVQSARSRLLGERIARQGIATRPARTVPAAAALTGAIQAQDNVASRLGIRARSANVREADVLAAISNGTVARTWLMRGTIHLVDAADVRWLVRLVGPSVQRRFRSRWRQLGLTDDVLARGLELLPELLAGRALTRHEVVAELRDRGLRLGDDPQLPTHLVVHACSTGLLCRGADRGRNTTCVLFGAWL